MAYTPPQEILEKYARVLVGFALASGKGIKPDDVVRITAWESAKPLYFEVYKAVLRSGGHPLGHYVPDDAEPYNLPKAFFELASERQLEHFPDKFLRGVVNQVDYSVQIIAEANKHALEGVDPAKMMRVSAAKKPYIDWLNEKENKGKYGWTLALYGTPAMAAEAKMTEEEYWEQIIQACFLDEADPIAKWREVFSEIGEYVDKLNALPIEKLHVQGDDLDLWVKLGEKKKWLGGQGRNIPSFEIFTSPDWRGTEGWIRFNVPLYRYGTLVEGIRLEFANGRVSKVSASRNEDLLTQMIATENADKVGEFSLTDKRHSRITKFMAETLYDENIGGPFGNTHIALGMAYKDCYDGDPGKVSKEEWERLGFNDSAVHTDMFSTTDRTVTAQLRGGAEQVIYEDGQFRV